MAILILPFSDEILKTTVEWRGFRAFPWNLPEDRPGSYGLLCLVNAKWYVGIGEILKRRCRAHSAGHSPKKLKAAIRKHGKAAFLVVPLYYDLVGPDSLHAIEADLIVEYDAIRYGYNIIAAGGRVGPYGPAFSATLSASKSTPEGKARASAASLARWERVKGGFHEARDKWLKENAALVSARVRANWADPEHRALRTEINRRNANEPERRAKVGRGSRAAWTPQRKREASERMNDTLLTPESKARAHSPQRLAERSARFKRLWADPEWREGMLAARRAARARKKPDA